MIYTTQGYYLDGQYYVHDLATDGSFPGSAVACEVLVEGATTRLATDADRLEIARSNKLSTIDRLRVFHESNVFPFDGKLFDADANSRDRLINASAAAHTALITGSAFSTEWVTNDNSTYSVPDAQTMLAIQMAYVYHGQSIHNHTQQLKMVVRAATTQSELDAIDITAGWPT